MGLLRQLGERDRSQAVAGQLTIDPHSVLAAHHQRVGLPAVRPLAPDGHGRRPQAVVEQYPCRFAGSVAEIERRVGRRRWRRQLAHPARVTQGSVLFGLADQVRVAAGGQLQLWPLGNGSAHLIGRTAKEVADHQGLRSGHASAQFGTDVAQADAPVAAELDAGHRRFRARPEVFLADGETHAVPVILVLGIHLLLACVTVAPPVVHGGLVENFVQAQGAGRHRALGVLHARLQRVGTAQIDGIHAQAAGDFIDHHFSRRHALQGAIAAHGARLHATRVIGSHRQVVLRHVIDRLRCGRTHCGHRRAVVDAPATVAAHVGAENLEAVVFLVHRQLVADIEGMALDAALELLVAVIGQADRYPVAVQRSHGSVENEDVVVLGAVAHGVAGVHVQGVQGKPRRLDHVHAFLRHFERALGGNHEVQRAAGPVVPAIAVVRLQRGRFDGRRLVALVEHQPVLGRVVQLFGHTVGVEQPLLGQVTMLVGLFRPHRLAVEDGGEQHGILQAGELIVVERRGAAHPHEAEAAIGVTLVQRRLGAVADRLVVELQLALGLAETLEIVPDQDCHGVADEHRYLARRQQRVGRVRFGPGDAVLFQVGGGDDTVWLQVCPQQAQVMPGIDAVSLGGLEQQGMALLHRPARHVLGTDVAGEHLVAADLGQRIVTETRLAVMAHPLLRRSGDAFLHQRGERLAAKWRHGHTDTSDQPALQEGAPGNITVGHA
ncbi:hypothetical protein PSNVIR_00477 [Pseudomonas sp. Nvir]|nr:hypothetical protein PSNVIR_00477 [Pseudomonas sp. Nvir]